MNLVYYLCKIIIIICLFKDLYPCPNKLSYNNILQESYKKFNEKEFSVANQGFQKIEICEEFSNTEKNLFIYSLSLYYECKNLSQKYCINNYKKAIQLMNKSLEILSKIPNSNIDLSRRFLFLGILNFELKDCVKTIYYVQKSLQIYSGIKQEFPEYQFYQKICK